MHITPRIVAFFARNHTPVHAPQLRVNNAASAMAEAANDVTEEIPTREENSIDGVDEIENNAHRPKEGGRGDERPGHQVATCELKISAAAGFSEPPGEAKRAEEEGGEHSEYYGIRADGGAESRRCHRCETTRSQVLPHSAALSSSLLYCSCYSKSPPEFGGNEDRCRPCRLRATAYYDEIVIPSPRNDLKLLVDI